MITLKQQYDTRITQAIDQLVMLGSRLRSCEEINVKATSKEYKQKCIDNVNKDITSLKDKLYNQIVSMSQERFLEKIC